LGCSRKSVVRVGVVLISSPILFFFAPCSLLPPDRSLVRFIFVPPTFYTTSGASYSCSPRSFPSFDARSIPALPHFFFAPPSSCVAFPPERLAPAYDQRRGDARLDSFPPAPIASFILETDPSPPLFHPSLSPRSCTPPFHIHSPSPLPIGSPPIPCICNPPRFRSLTPPFAATLSATALPTATASFTPSNSAADISGSGSGSASASGSSTGEFFFRLSSSLETWVGVWTASIRHYPSCHGGHARAADAHIDTFILFCRPSAPSCGADDKAWF
jgi:hypothetical protein